MLLLALILSATASPDRVAAAFELGTNVTDIALSEDGRWVAAIDKGSDELRVLDTLTWDASSWDSAPCDGLSGVAGVEMADGAQRFYVGCANGNIRWVEVTTQGVGTGDAIEVGDEAIKGLAAGDGAVWALEAGEGIATLHHIDAEDDTVDGSGAFPVELTLSGLEDMAWTGVDVLVLHGEDNVSQVDGDGGGLSVPDTSFSYAECVDLTVGVGPSVLAACGEIGVLRYVTTAYEWALALDDDNGLVEPTAVAVDESDEDDPFLVVADDGAAFVFEYNPSTGYPDTEASAEIDLGATTLQEMVSTDGYTVASTDGGALWVLTGRPWVEITELSPETAVDGDTVTVTFLSEATGTWEILLGDEGETSLAEGEVTAGELVSASIEVDGDTFAEGANLLQVVVTGTTMTGRDGAVLSVDNPPSRVRLSDDNVSYGESTIALDFEGVDDEDLLEYRLYISVTPFERADYAEGGPTFDGQDDLTRIDHWDADVGAFVIDGIAPGDDVSVTLYPLTNGTTYYLAVRAVDESELEGPMSNVVSATPVETYTLCERTGEDCEVCGCGTPGPGSGLAAALAGLFAIGRRRSNSARAPLAALLLLVAGPTAHAAEKEKEVKPRSNLQLRYGNIWYADDNPILDQFDKPHNIFWLEGGPSLWGLAELNLGVGWYNESGYLWGEDGSQAQAQADRLTAIPVTASVTARLDVLREQPIVPTATIGGDYWLWRERYDDGTDKSQVGGGKMGWHYGFGAQLLLDVFDRKQASLVEARAGIRDSYLVGEYRVQTVEEDAGISFSSSSVTLGLKVNY